MNMTANNLSLMKIAQFVSCALYMCDTDFEFCLETCQLRQVLDEPRCEIRFRGSPGDRSV